MLFFFPRPLDPPAKQNIPLDLAMMATTTTSRMMMTTMMTTTTGPGPMGSGEKGERKEEKLREQVAFV